MLKEILKKILKEIGDEIHDFIKNIPDGDYLRGNVNFSVVAKDIIEKYIKKGEWIPCSERLPEIGSPVIITSYDGRVWDNIYYDYADETDNKPCFHRWDEEYWNCFKPEVIAWMPRPEPYKGGDDD